jgi:hypothetical protein
VKNKTSQVIMVRDGNRNVITMYNDFNGPTKDFAMVVPVPVVLKKNDIKVIDQSLFQRLNDYSALDWLNIGIKIPVTGKCMKILRLPFSSKI